MPTGHAPGAAIAFALPASRTAHAPGSAVVLFDENAFAAQRGDHLGMTLEERRLTLENRLEQGVALYCGLFTDMPDRAGNGGTEVSVTGYARVSVSRWANKVEGASVRRTNAQAILWTAWSQPVTIVGWGLWTASSGGRLRFFDHIRTSGGDRNPVTRLVPTGSQFAIGTGVHGIGLAL